MDRNNRIGRRERHEILESVSRGVAVDKSHLKPLRPNTILRALEESIARRRSDGHIWPSLPRQFWVKITN